MAENDWAVLGDVLGTASIARGVTHGEPRPNGGGDFLYAFASKEVTTGASALIVNKTNFNPTPINTGGSIRGAIKRGVSTGEPGYSAFIFSGLQGSSVNDNAYMLGFSDEDPSFIVLKKGAIVQGITGAAVGSEGNLRKSTASVDPDTWTHLRLDQIVNLNGDVILKAFMSDLTLNAVGAPDWQPIPGIDDFVDDALGVASGSVPYTTSRFGFGMQINEEAGRRSYFDHIEVLRQLP